MSRPPKIVELYCAQSRRLDRLERAAWAVVTKTVQHPDLPAAMEKLGRLLAIRNTLLVARQEQVAKARAELRDLLRGSLRARKA